MSRNQRRFIDRRGAIALSLVLCLVGSVFVLAGVALAAEVVYEVTRNHDADWHFDSGTDQSECPTGQASTSSHAFEPGPVGLPGDEPDSATGTPPEGQGSLEFRIGTNGDSLERFRNTRYAGKNISQLQELIYWTYTENVDLLEPETPAIWVRLAIDKNGDGVQDDTLVFEPTYQDGENGEPQHRVQGGRWQRWIADDSDVGKPEGNWWLASVGAVAGSFLTLDEWVGQIGDATIVNPNGKGGVFVGAGCGGSVWAGFVGNIDEFRIRFSDSQDTTVFDMEPEVPGSARRLDCNPETGVAPTGTVQTITCTATTDSNPSTPVEGTRIDIEATGANDPSAFGNPPGDTPQIPDFSCTTDADGRCTVSHGPSTPRAGVTTYRAWIDDDNHNATVEADREEGRDEARQPGSRPEIDDTDVVERTWSPSRLDCEPETGSLRPGSSHTITCTARDAGGMTAAGAQIDAEATGPNDPDAGNSQTTPDFTCTTGEDGTCTLVHGPGGRGTTTTTGRTTYRAWIDHDKLDFSSTHDTGEGVNEGSAPGFSREIDDTDVTEMNWSTTAPESTPSPCPTGSPSSSPTGSPSPSPTGSPSGTTSPSPSPTGGTASPSATPTSRGTASPTPTASAAGSVSASQATPTPTPTSSGSPCVTPSPSQSSPSPTPSEEPTPDPSPTDDEPHGDPLLSGPCQGYFPDSRQPDPNGNGEIIVGTPGDDTLRGGDGDDTICGLGGKDTLIGVGGEDLLAGNGSNDILRGNVGNDTLRGAGGEDTLAGGAGADEVYAGGGDDILRGGGGKDLLKGGGGKDVLRGRWQSDRLFGGKSADALNGGPGNDLVNGGPGQDVCRSGGGDDRFRNCE
ncbi:MAG TPA: calcium-binding protein [Actinomycetota bacterium]|nr:calcium-binding protein [Actinomycetota bacterium]